MFATFTSKYQKGEKQIQRHTRITLTITIVTTLEKYGKQAVENADR